MPRTAQFDGWLRAECTRAMKEGLIMACHDCSEGGAALALAGDGPGRRLGAVTFRSSLFRQPAPSLPTIGCFLASLWGAI